MPERRPEEDASNKPGAVAVAAGWRPLLYVEAPGSSLMADSMT